MEDTTQVLFETKAAPVGTGAAEAVRSGTVAGINTYIERVVSEPVTNRLPNWYGHTGRVL